MWWLSFPEGVVIIEASSLAHARLLVAQSAFSRASQFVEGYPINPDLAALVPAHTIGRMLSLVEARELVKLLKYGPQKLVPNFKTEPGQSRRA
jgi:hypothetical protein